MMRISMLKGLLIAGLIIVIDQLTKYIVVQELILYQSVPIFTGFNITRVHNMGAAFSFLNDAGGWQRFFFIGVASLLSVVIVFWMKSLKQSKYCLFYALALILGGAVGNVIDRISYGYVIDFIDVSLSFLPWQLFNPWPTFNISDSAIFLGAVLTIIDTICLNGDENTR